MLKKSKKSKKEMVVTVAEHERWHKEHGGCGSKKEHDECMKECGITIKKKSS
ncbi:MAG: hypothetical protein V1892_00530 [bacterium]